MGGRYRLQQQIGQGGMAAVWQAYDTVLERVVAVKLLTPEHTQDAHAYDRAHNEARYAARIGHPNVAAVYDFGTSRRAGLGAAYLVMELIEGPRLVDYLRQGPMDWRFAVKVCAEVAAGLAAAHGHGIVHRDIKPANVVITPAGAKILDFGIAAMTGTPDRNADGSMVGTAGYMAPERVEGHHPVTPASDMYALGVLLHQCLAAGRPPPPGPLPEPDALHLFPELLVLPTVEDLAPRVATIWAGCMRDDPVQRPTAVAAALILSVCVDAQVYVPVVTPSRPPTSTSSGFVDSFDAETMEHRPDLTALPTEGWQRPE
ncbi:serine/threonine-protein kinase [Allocatelliglobosispora scoriae]|uniref:serine/threonine-protein kinase n=1 Tax=Allocatelliglobosispora scoriae TaxID=643052 RepID=UPI00160D8034|nr:serine/threonine-protein kinase [Allocatelliglobosispora scoriae]